MVFPPFCSLIGYGFCILVANWVCFLARGNCIFIITKSIEESSSKCPGQPSQPQRSQIGYPIFRWIITRVAKIADFGHKKTKGIDTSLCSSPTTESLELASRTPPPNFFGSTPGVQNFSTIKSHGLLRVGCAYAFLLITIIFCDNNSIIGNQQVGSAKLDESELW